LLEELREELASVAREMAKLGLVSGGAGNASARAPTGELMVITPTQFEFEGRSLKYEEMKPADVVVIDFNGNVVEGERRPSSEFRLHAAIYRIRPDVGAVVHTHSPFACVLAASRACLPPVLDEVALFLGGAIDVADYAPPGSAELAENAIAALGNKNAVILANHGAVACGRSPREALDNAVLLERAAMAYVLSRLLGGAVELPPDTVTALKDLVSCRK
jgi:L-fuculose-phosphate aldolase